MHLHASQHHVLLGCNVLIIGVEYRFRYRGVQVVRCRLYVYIAKFCYTRHRLIKIPVISDIPASIVLPVTLQVLVTIPTS